MTVPGCSEPEPGLYREGDLVMITFSTQFSEQSGTWLCMFIPQDQKAQFAQSEAKGQLTNHIHWQKTYKKCESGFVFLWETESKCY